jgi:arabinogalactan endo-1,4-beta-galactosidase
MRASFVLMCAALLGGVFALTGSAAQPQEIRGADVSMLIELEKAGARYYADATVNTPSDPIAILKENGVEWFRLRLFVDPPKEYRAAWGATQDLEQVRALAKRVKAVGGKFLLDLHYSDTWADGVKQIKPRAWEGQDFETLVSTVHDYTRDTLRTLADDGSMPDMVQIGNEIAGGMLYPDGKVHVPEADQATQWEKFSKLLNAGSKAVREAGTPEHPIRVMIHIHGGGHDGVPMWFFSKLDANPVDFDVIGLSFYPAWGDSIERLKVNLAALAARYDKPVILAEIAYPAEDIGEVKEAGLLKWPLTPQGQSAFTRDVRKAVAGSKNYAGMFWWYPEAVPAGGYQIWRGGAEAFFEHDGRPREVLKTFGRE